MPHCWSRWSFSLCVLFILVSCGRSSHHVPNMSAGAVDLRGLEAQVRQIFEVHRGEDSIAQQAEMVDRLESLGPAAIPSIERYLSAQDSQQQAMALISLNRLNAQRRAQDFSGPLVQRYLTLLSDDNILIRTYAMESLIRSGHRFRPVIERFRVSADPAVQQRLDIVMRELE